MPDVKHTVSFPEEIEQRVREVRAELIVRRIGDGTRSDAVCRLIAAGHRHREEIFREGK